MTTTTIAKTLPRDIVLYIFFKFLRIQDIWKWVYVHYMDFTKHDQRVYIKYIRDMLVPLSLWSVYVLIDQYRESIKSESMKSIQYHPVYICMQRVLAKKIQVLIATDVFVRCAYLRYGEYTLDWWHIRPSMDVCETLYTFIQCIQQKRG